MKKVFMKSFLGIPLAIFIYEIINIILSITTFENQYFRLDMFNLTEIIITYLELSIMAYLLFFSMYYDTFWRNSGKEEHEIAKEHVKIIVGIVILFGIMVYIISCIYPDFYAGAISFPIILLAFGVIAAIKGMCDEKNIKAINKKIKENQKKKD